MKMSQSLAILAVFRNESHIIREFIEHHIELGVDRFYLIDNDSDDNWRDEISDYLDRIEIFFYDTVSNKVQLDNFQNRQPRLYAKHVKKIKEDWVLICDLDEFTYTRNDKSIKELLQRCEDEDVTQIIIPLRNFTSNKLIRQPNSVRKSFTERNSYDGLPPNDDTAYVPSMHKSIVKRENISKIEITVSSVDSGYSVFADLNFEEKTKWFDSSNKDAHNFFHSWRATNHGIFKYRHKSDEEQDKCLIVINHYQHQSNEHYINTKMSRGVIGYVCVNKHEKTTHQYWTRRYLWLEENPTIQDTELRDMVIENERKMARR